MRTRVSPLLMTMLLAASIAHAQPDQGEKLARQIIEGDFCADGSKSHLTLSATGDCPECAVMKNSNTTGLAALASQTVGLKKVTEQGEQRDRARAFYRFLRKNPEFGGWMSSAPAPTVESLTRQIETTRKHREKALSRIPENEKKAAAYEKALTELTAVPKTRPSPETTELVLEELRSLVFAYEKDKSYYRKQLASLLNDQAAAKSKKKSKSEQQYAARDIAMYRSDLELAGKTLAELIPVRDWLSDSKKPAPKPNALRRVLQRLEEMRQHARASLGYLKADIERFDQRLADFERRLAELKEQLAKQGANNDDAEIDEVEREAERFIGSRLYTTKFLPSCGLTVDEMLALVLYSGSYYRFLNAALRSGEGDKVKPFTDVLNVALKKINPFNGLVKRGADLPQDALQRYEVGNEVTLPGFTSASLSSGFGGNHRFTIQSKSGRLIAPYSMSYGEHEVLFPAGARFKVLSAQKYGGITEFVMEEVGP